MTALQKIFISTLIMTSHLLMANSDVMGHFYLNGMPAMHHHKARPGMKFNIGDSINIEFYYMDKKSKAIFTEYKELHGKIMHMVIIKEDLSEFKHIHPYFDPITGRFQITTNIKQNDPDNFANQNLFSTAGTYYIMVDADIKGIGMRMAMTKLIIQGESQREAITPQMWENNKITKFFTKQNKQYKSELYLEQVQGAGSELFNFSLALYENSNGVYTPIQNATAWLKAGAHNVFFAENYMTDQMPMKMIMGHMHAKVPEDPGFFDFSYHNTGLLKLDNYKMWIQVKIGDKVETFDFSFKLYPKISQ